MFNPNNLRTKMSPSFLAWLFLIGTICLITIFPLFWLEIVSASLFLFILNILVKSIYQWKVTRELEELMAVYMRMYKDEEVNTNKVENFAHGETVWSEQAHFFSVQPIVDGVVFLFSIKQFRLLPWDNIWSIKKYSRHPKFAELTLVSKDEFSGERKIILPWREEFWVIVPESKILGTIDY